MGSEAVCGARTQDRGPGSYGTRTGIGRHLDPTDSKTSKRSRKTEHIGLTQSPADRCAALAAPLRARQRPWAAVVSERSAQLHVDGKAAGGALELQHLLELCPPTCPRLLPAVPRTSLVLSPAVLLQAAALLGPERQTRDGVSCDVPACFMTVNTNAGSGSLSARQRHQGQRFT